MDSVVQILITIASSGGTAGFLAVTSLGLFLTAFIAYKIYSQVKHDSEIKEAKTEFEAALTSGDANRLQRAVERLRDVSQ